MESCRQCKEMQTCVKNTNIYNHENNVNKEMRWYSSIKVICKNKQLEQIKKSTRWKNTKCYNLISGMAAACRWGVESGKLVYPSMF
jgi:hypothetical protein